ncbi:integral peroxisomal membrane peroxin-domain-containing protein [Polychytrium aggregatum]|uniref:integral peroxisomal membrane peroxin-domain-containing protein n=1 Tax=Polychytrium aggregatum TaxID=110093 RepID=UPI0022FDC038|nr:integral peroxisomal membrane peroxin-domain-containing protein [Polychytrium aggregatum]KAI9204666.1 integral peroxisomal membrane peroxin-domain-containing protein [Polychytrium aggregatum]
MATIEPEARHKSTKSLPRFAEPYDEPQLPFPSAFAIQPWLSRNTTTTSMLSDPPNLASLPTITLPSEPPDDTLSGSARSSVSSIAPSFIAPSRTRHGLLREESHPGSPPFSNQPVKDSPTSSGSSGSSSPSRELSSSEDLNIAAQRQPPLNLLTATPWNISRLVLRLGPVVDAFDIAVDVLLWTYPFRTGMICIGWIVLCTYPILGFIIPQACLILYMLSRYKTSSHRRPLPTPPIEELERVTSSTSLLSSIPTVNHQQYQKNLKFMQNLMVIYCDLYDRAAAVHQTLDWHDSELTTRWLRVIALAIPMAYAVVLVVPVRTIVMVAGLMVLMMHTSLFRTLMMVLPSFIWKRLVNWTSRLIRTFPAPDSAVDLGVVDDFEGATPEEEKAKSETMAVDVYENQRWWNESGWAARLLKSERPCWSDVTGKLTRHPKSLIELPSKDWVWATEWVVDREWYPCDNDGWVYSDHNWKNETEGQCITSLTRRRRWVRSMRPVDGSKKTTHLD